VAEDKEAAAKWYRKAAEQGHAGALIQLGRAGGREGDILEC
jgi:TPR repeat protein